MHDNVFHACYFRIPIYKKQINFRIQMTKAVNQHLVFYPVPLSSTHFSYKYLYLTAVINKSSKI